MKGGGTKLWKVVLGLLCAGIVGLTAVIVVVKINENRVTYPSTIHTKELSELNAEAAQLSLSDAKLLYEEAIKNAPTELDRQQTKVEYGRFMINKQLSGDGVLELESVDTSVLGANYKMILYATLRDYYYVNGNEELSEKYNDMIGEAIQDSNYAAGG